MDYFQPQPKTKNWRSKKYLGWLAKQPPLLAGRGDTVYHHLKLFRNGGTGKKPPDSDAIPIADSVHRAIHQYGERRVLCEGHGYDKGMLRDICDTYVRIWERENNISV